MWLISNKYNENIVIIAAYSIPNKILSIILLIYTPFHIYKPVYKIKGPYTKYLAIGALSVDYINWANTKITTIESCLVYPKN